MNKQLTKVLAIILLSFSAVSCGSDDEEPDTTAPQVTIEAPTADQKIKREATIPLEVTFTDDKGLKKCTISLTKSTTKSLKGTPLAWEPKMVEILLSGKEVEKKMSDVFSEAAPFDCAIGFYDLNLTIEDEVGKTTEKTVQIELVRQ